MAGADRVDGGGVRARPAIRRVRVGCRLALALTLFAGHARAQQSWTTRVAAATSEDLAAIVREMTAAADAPVDAEFGRAYVSATFRHAQQLGDAGATPEALDAAFSGAREAARRFGHDESRLRLEELAVAYVADRAVARRQLEAAIERYPGATRARPLALLSLAELARQLGDHDAALAHVDRALREAPPASGSAADVESARRLRVEAEGVRGQVWLEVGVIDLAATSFAQRAELAASAPPGFEADVERAQTRLDAAQVDFARIDLDGVIERLDDAFLADVARLDPGLAALAAGVRAQAELELVRDGGGDVAVARARLDAVLGSGGFGPSQTFVLECGRVDLMLLAGELAAARSLAAGLRARADAGIAAPARATLASLEAEIALAAGAPRAELASARAVLAAAITDLHAAWRAAPLRRGGRGFLQWGDRRTALSTLARLEMTLDATEAGRVRALDAILATQALGTLSRQVGAEAIDVAGVRARLLAPGRGLLVFLPAMKRTHVFALDGDRVEHHEAPSRDELLRGFTELATRAATRFPRDAAANDVERRRNRVDALSRTLADALLGGAVGESVRGWRELIVSGAELIGDANVEILRPGGGVPLGVSHALERAPSVSLLAHLARTPPRGGAGPELVLVANPLAGGAVDGRRREPAILSDAEVERLTAPFAAARVTLRFGADAHPGVLRDPAIAGARCVAFFAHGAYDAERQRSGERPAGLELSATDADPDGRLWCAHVELARAPDLVALYACGSERGPARLGDDAGAHLGSAFFASGARVVISSPADIGLASTLELSRVFHERLRAGDAPAEAMRRAREALLRDPRTADPSEWGLVRVHGLAHEPLFERGSAAFDGAITPDGREFPWFALLASTAIAVAAIAVVVSSRSDRADRVRLRVR